MSPKCRWRSSIPFFDRLESLSKIHLKVLRLFSIHPVEIWLWLSFFSLCKYLKIYYVLNCINRNKFNDILSNSVSASVSLETGALPLPSLLLRLLTMSELPWLMVEMSLTPFFSSVSKLRLYVHESILTRTYCYLWFKKTNGKQGNCNKVRTAFKLFC